MSLLLIFATRYDVVTIQTFSVAEHLRIQIEALQVESEVLLENDATSDHFNLTIAKPFEVFAFYSHGDEDGRILAQDRLPVWTDDSCPDLRGGAVFAHACRAMLALERQFERLNVRVAVGYTIDLKLPPHGSEPFWDFYRQLHVLVPIRLLQATPLESIRAEFYEVATAFFDQIYRSGGGLIELIALQESRDALTILESATRSTKTAQIS